MTQAKDRKVLDIGCGFGLISFHLAAFGSQMVSAVDSNEEKFSILQRILSQFNPPLDSIEVKLGDALNLTYEDNYFDSVIFSEVLEHLYESPIQILQELYRILKPNGVLILTTPNVMKLENKIKFFLNINIYQDIERFCYNPRYCLHFREYTEKDLKILLEK